MSKATVPAEEWSVTISLADMPKEDYAALLKAHKFWNKKRERELKKLRYSVYTAIKV